MDNNDKKGMNAMAAGLAGMIIGAGVGAVATKVLSDKKTRDRLLNTVNDARERVVSYAHRISRQAGRTKEMAEDKMKETAADLREHASASKKK